MESPAPKYASAITSTNISLSVAWETLMKRGQKDVEPEYQEVCCGTGCPENSSIKKTRRMTISVDNSGYLAQSGS